MVNLPSLIDEDVYYTKYVVDRSRVVVGDLKINIMQVHVCKKTIPAQDHRSKKFTRTVSWKKISCSHQIIQPTPQKLNGWALKTV